MAMRKGRARAKTKFVDGKTFIHPHISYRMTDTRRRWINRVNDFVRRGMTFKEIAEVMEVSESTVAIYYYGMALNCLSDKQLKALAALPGAAVTTNKILTRLAAPGEIPDRVQVLQPIYTNVTVHYYKDSEITDSMPVPFELRTSKFIPSSTSINYGKRNNEHETFELVDVVDIELTKSALKPYVIMYRGACCNI